MSNHIIPARTQPPLGSLSLLAGAAAAAAGKAPDARDFAHHVLPAVHPAGRVGRLTQVVAGAARRLCQAGQQVVMAAPAPPGGVVQGLCNRRGQACM